MKKITLILLLALPLGILPKDACAKPSIDVNRIADAIYKAEGGAKTKYPYGILKKYKTTTPRQACINTINSNHKRWDGKVDFIEYLGKTYCPVGTKNDPKGLNKNWVKNVRYFMNQ